MLYRKVRKGCAKDATKRLARNFIFGHTEIMDAVCPPVRFRSGFHRSLVVPEHRSSGPTTSWRCRYRLAHPQWGTDPDNTFHHSSGSILVHHAGETLVCMGVALRCGGCAGAWLVWIKWRCFRECSGHRPHFLTDIHPGSGERRFVRCYHLAFAAGDYRIKYSFPRSPAHFQLAADGALVSSV